MGCVQSLCSELVIRLDTKTPYTPLVRPACRPRPMKQLEPRITEKYVVICLIPLNDVPVVDVYHDVFVSDIAIFVLKRDVKLQLTNHDVCIQCLKLEGAHSCIR